MEIAGVGEAGREQDGGSKGAELRRQWYSAQLAEVEHGETSAFEHCTEMFMYRISQLSSGGGAVSKIDMSPFGTKAILKVSPEIQVAVSEPETILLLPHLREYLPKSGDICCHNWGE